MKRHDDVPGWRWRSDGLPVTFAHPGDPHESLTARRAYASLPRLGSDGTLMTRHEDSQRSGRWAVMFGDGGDVRVADRVVAPMLACLAWGDGCR